MIIALTTDFGSGSTYVAQLKGVLLSALPEARLVDVTHDIAPQDLREAELVVRATAWAFPVGTTHLVVVDPGVGTSRRAIALQARGMSFVGPDNGILGIPAAEPGARAVHLNRPQFFREPLAPTFHGRDLFAPIAAELAGGVALTELGTPIDDPLPSTLPRATLEAKRARGVTLGADRFGNLTTNLPAKHVRGWRVLVNGKELPRAATYGLAPENAAFALPGSDGYLEIAVKNGSAAQLLGARDSEVICEP